MSKTKDSSKKIGDIKAACHARKGMIKERNRKDLV